jgi:outer membrane protein assembly factor BamB
MRIKRQSHHFLEIPIREFKVQRIMNTRLTIGLAALAMLLAFSLQAIAADSPQWRGPAGQGHADAKNLPTQFGPDQNMTWRTELPGEGWSSPVIEGNQIWLTAAFTTPMTEAEKKKKLESNTGSQPLNLAGKLAMHALCVDRQSGKLLHNIKLLEHDDPQWSHTLNSFASPSPVLANGKLYCHFGSHGTACLDTKSQKVIWRNQSIESVLHENGPGSTPVLWNDLLMFHMDGSDKQYVVALDTKTGKQAWKTSRSGEMNSNPQLKKAYGTPLIVDMHGREQLISPGADWVYGYDPATGKELWKLNYGVLGFSIVPKPVAAHGMIYLCTSFMRSELIAIQYEENGKPVEPKIVWNFDKQMPQKPSPLVVDDLIYVVGDRGIATCLDSMTGELIWTERLSGNFSASPMYADGKIYLMSHEGKIIVLAPGREYQELATNDLQEALMASPAAVAGALFIRSEKALYRFEK